MSIHMLVLSGGFGTRLKSELGEMPKTLAPIGERFFLDYLLKEWIEQGITHYTFLLHHKYEQIINFINSQANESLLQHCKIDFIVESEPLGTGGAIANAIVKLGLTGNLLVANSDTWVPGAISSLLDDYSGGNSIASVFIDDVGRYGRLRIVNGYVVEIDEKSIEGGPGWINAGIYMLDTKVFDNWQGHPFSLEKVTLRELAQTGKLKCQKLKNCDFIDIGVPSDYHRFIQWAKNIKLD
ncbi:sugar phosphate nucleotidyltransferase [Catenovulum sediminis]|uniref:Sugar phosphate nucleotidyltransferase n=1 Tax=Catenovulum sediminis TaxID=1740262 RepID=A0ABV1RGX8_9ALTE